MDFLPALRIILPQDLYLKPHRMLQEACWQKDAQTLEAVSYTHLSEAAFFHSMREAPLLKHSTVPAVVKEAG